MTTHADHRFSVTVFTEDIAVAYCLRALSDLAQETGNTRITWGGTTTDAWRNDGNRLTFRFSQPSYREAFVVQAGRVLPAGSWTEQSRSDSDPATPRS